MCHTEGRSQKEIELQEHKDGWLSGNPLTVEMS
jgi:hypothetical protein